MTLRRMTARDYTQQRTGYPQFVEFVMNPMELYSEEIPSPRTMAMWNLIKDIQVIRENVLLENFVEWANINIG